MGDSRSNCWIGGAGFTVGLEDVCLHLGEHSATLHTFSPLGSTLCMDDWRISKRAFREKKVEAHLARHASFGHRLFQPQEAQPSPF
jgi:hypothetical protein